MILNNANVAGNYTVGIAATAATCRTLTIGYAGNAKTITLQISGTLTVALTVAGEGASADDFVIDQGGRFENSSTAASGDIVSVTGSTRVKSGG
jgi:hypothetical protein